VEFFADELGIRSITYSASLAAIPNAISNRIALLKFVQEAKP
jgi:hypothetical protein